ncbi:hypothetical protein CGLO_14710 [Colletotrichum gloeosporioides Cg-14]|uniref:Uncharacterized protein n=1 Tax=Colletotrichum gloeosporioides (strain Cg-14) TaxID=1237896 RepID=T0K3C2_COLGC|nr:hypothetical protein CGLO_14710 [Colletotrichum gloeosporioides Cg-14]
MWHLSTVVKAFIQHPQYAEHLQQMHVKPFKRLNPSIEDFSQE